MKGEKKKNREKSFYTGIQHSRKAQKQHSH